MPELRCKVCASGPSGQRLHKCPDSRYYIPGSDPGAEMLVPQRIQRKRVKGWRMPEGAVYVGRPTKWGNPFLVQDFLMFGAMRDAYAGWCIDFASHREARWAAVDLYRDIITGCWSPSKVDELDDQSYDRLIDDLSAWKKRIGGLPLEIARSELSGRDLCCWCSPTQACHADVLLELANA